VGRVVEAAAIRCGREKSGGRARISGVVGIGGPIRKAHIPQFAAVALRPLSEKPPNFLKTGV
jgi:hypothetical protein